MPNFFGFSRQVTVAPQGRRFAFVFICQQGELEIKAALLAASLKRNLRCRYELIACVPEAEHFGTPALETLSFLKELGARVADIRNPFGPEYPYANKIPCLQVGTTSEKIVYLDTDMLCMKPFHDEGRFVVPLNLKPVDLQTYTTSPDVWRRTYEAAHVDMPTRKTMSTVSEEEGPPLFNGGFIAARSGADLATAWLYCAKHLMADKSLPVSVPWNDQPSLAVAVQLAQATFDVLEETYNYPAHLRPVKDRTPYFCHYHTPAVIRREPRLNQLVQELASEHDALAKILERNEAWAALLKPYAVRPRRTWKNIGTAPSFEGPELVITGIPGRGAARLAELVGQHENCIVAIDPPEIDGYLEYEVVPTHVATHFRDLRRAVLDGTSGTVEASDFIVAIKNETGFLARLEVLAGKVLRDARFVVCVGNPIDTIAAWKRSDAPALAPSNRPKMDSETERLAWLWRYFAELIPHNHPRIQIVRHDDVMANPATVLAAVFKGMHPGRPRIPIQSAILQRDRDQLNQQDLDVIRRMCEETARVLGVPCD